MKGMAVGDWVYRLTALLNKRSILHNTVLLQWVGGITSC